MVYIYYLRLNLLKHIQFLKKYANIDLVLKCALTDDKFVVVGNPSNIVLPEVLQIISDEINDGEWKKLANYIGITKNAVENIEIESETTKEKMMKCFEEINDNITWKFLKIQLQKINRYDIIEIVKNKTLLTIGKYFLSIIHIISFLY